MTDQTRHGSFCERVVVTDSKGREYDLGSPHSVFFRLRVWMYIARRYITRS